MQVWGMACAVTALAGCELVFPLAGPDARGTGPDGCAGPFGATMTQLGEFQELPSEYDPAVFDAEVELWLSMEPGPDAQLFTTSRAGLGVRFVIPLQPAPFGIAGEDESNPALTSDGRILMFLSTRNGGERVHEVRRASPVSPFEGVAVVSGLPDLVDSGFDLSGDGRAIYFALSDDIIQVATRESVDAPFGPHKSLGIGGEFPSVSSDERELYYVRDETIFRSTRPSRNDTFGDEEKIFIGAALSETGDPEISPDGKTLYFGMSGSLWFLTRACDPE